MAQIRIERPEKKNALTAVMYTGLVEAFKRAESDPAVRVLLLCGSDTCFTAGNDLQDFMNTPPRDESNPTIRFIKQLPVTRKPIIAAVAGPAVGIGTTMLLHCDLVYADPNTRFQLPFVTLGLCPEAASSYLLPQIVGFPRAAELLLMGDPFSAQQALEMGMISGITPAGEVIATTARKSKTDGRAPGRFAALDQGPVEAGSRAAGGRDHGRRADPFWRAADVAGGGRGVSRVLRAAQARLLEVHLIARAGERRLNRKDVACSFIRRLSGVGFGAP